MYTVVALLIRLTKVCLGVLTALLHPERRELHLLDWISMMNEHHKRLGNVSHVPNFYGIVT